MHIADLMIPRIVLKNQQGLHPDRYSSISDKKYVVVFKESVVWSLSLGSELKMFTNTIGAAEPQGERNEKYRQLLGGAI